MEITEIKEIIPFAIFLVIYTGTIFAGLSWMLNSKLNPIKEALTNHITDTNKKIDRLADNIKETNAILRENTKETNQKIDKQSDRFDKLYNLLLEKSSNETKN